MAIDEDSYQRRKQREKEEEEEEAARKAPGAQKKGDAPAAATGDKLLDLIARSEPMIEQLDHLYMMFIAGADKIPPNEKRKQLDQTMAGLQAMSKPSQSAAFRYNALHARYVTYRDRWDKMLKDLEDGKLKRTKDFKRR